MALRGRSDGLARCRMNLRLWDYDAGVFYVRPWFRYDAIMVGCLLVLDEATPSALCGTANLSPPADRLVRLWRETFPPAVHHWTDHFMRDATLGGSGRVQQLFEPGFLLAGSDGLEMFPTRRTSGRRYSLLNT